MPKVSVIVPVYGVEKYIERCARSLFEQTLDDIEYIFIDDCTKDASIDVLNRVLVEYPQRKPQVLVHRMEHNSGTSLARKKGMEIATGEYVIHCDSDDWVDTDMYRAMYEKAVEENADMVICDYCYTDGKSRTVSIGIPNNDTRQYWERMIIYGKWALWNRLVRRSVYMDNVAVLRYPKYSMAEDIVLSVQFAILSKKICYLPKPFYYYYQRPGSIARCYYGRNDEAAKHLFDESFENRRELVCFLRNNNIDEYYVKMLYWSLYHECWKLMLDSECREKILKECVNLTAFVLSSSDIPFRRKILYLMSRMHLYPLPWK